MKKVLYGTTALVAAGALMASPASAEEKIKLGLGGYMNNYFGFGDTDSDADVDRGNTGLFSDGEIWFLGETTLDNGISFGVNVQLESAGFSDRGGTGDVIDEDFAYIEGSFGRINLGSENSAAYLMHFAAPAVGVPLNTGWITTFVPDDGAITGGGGFRTPRLSTYLDWNNDENIITYFTPRFAGFQIGATYAPAVTGSGDGANIPVQANEDTEFHNGFSVGLHFTQSFNALDFTMAGAFNYVDEPDTGNLGDILQAKAGLNLGYAGFSFGGSFGYEDSDRTVEGWSADAGISYSTGPWGVSVTGFVSEVEGAAADSDEDELVAVTGAVSYALGPGIDVSGSVIYGDWDEEGGLDSEGVMFVTGIRISY